LVLVFILVPSVCIGWRQRWAPHGAGALQHYWRSYPIPTCGVCPAPLDSASTTGAYRFPMRPGDTTTRGAIWSLLIWRPC